MKGLVLKASAGTGKTYRLSLEYISALMRGERDEDILVMTFTKKATAEIKERVISFLQELYRDETSELYENIKKLYPNVDLSRERVEKVYFEIAENEDRLKIYTIDSFINNIFKSVIAPYLNIFKYEIIDDEENTEYLFKAFEKIVADKEQFDKFKIFLQNRTERNIEVYLDIIKQLIENRWKLISLGENLIEKHNFESRGSYENTIQYILETFDKVKVKKGNEKEASYYTVTAFSWLFDLKDKDIKEECLKYWNEIFSAEKLWHGNKLQNSKKFNFDDEFEIFTKLLSDLKEKMAVEIYNKEILPLENEIMAFIKNLYYIYDKIKFTERKLTHSDVSNYLFEYLENEEVNLIENGKITQYFKDIFDSDFKVVFIDEFQDTSILQWKILKGLINQCENIICVGDEKQSIYGWRGGEKNLFENLGKILGIDEETMNISYRSRKNIVNVTNKIFDGVSNLYNNEEKNIAQNSFWNFINVEGKSEEEGYVEILELPLEEVDEEEKIKSKKKSWKSDEENEEDSIPEGELGLLINSLKEKFNGKYKDIAIIARSNKQLNEIGKVLTENKIPFILETNDSIIYHRAISPIFKLIKYLVNKDMFSLLEFLRSDCVKIDNRTMQDILNNKPITNEYIRKVLEKIQRLGENLEDRNIFINIIKEFNITTLYKSKNDLKNLFQFYQITKEYDSLVDLYNDLIKEKESVKFKQTSLEDGNVITLLSIHKSKGLEYNTVYYFHKLIKKRNRSGIQFHIDFKEPFEKIDNFIFIDRKYEKVLEFLGNEYNFLKEIETKESEEEINGIYVAMTRAKKNLFIIKGKKSNTYLEYGLNCAGEKIFGTPEMEIDENLSEDFDENEKNIEIRNEYFTSKLDLIEKDIEEVEIPNRNILIDAITEEKRLIGTAVHHYLEFILNDTEEEHREARKIVISKYGSIVGEKRLENILDSKEFKKFFEENKVIFSKEWDYIYPEYEIYYTSEKKLYRLDRLMIKKATPTEKGKILIVDYKTGGLAEEQLNKYVEIIREQLYTLKQEENYQIDKKFLEIKLS